MHDAEKAESGVDVSRSGQTEDTKFEALGREFVIRQSCGVTSTVGEQTSRYVSRTTSSYATKHRWVSPW